MRGLLPRINLVLAALLLAAGCASDRDAAKKGKPIRRIRVYVESRHDLPDRTLPALVGRSNPMRFSAEKLPILNEVHTEHAALLDEPGGFRVELKFESLGARILESYTSAAAGRHLLIMTEIDGEARWIAAPVIRQRLAQGVLSFVPDASREEMERLVTGLNQEAKNRRSRLMD